MIGADRGSLRSIRKSRGLIDTGNAALLAFLYVQVLLAEYDNPRRVENQSPDE